MHVFTSEELQRRPAEVQEAALGEPALITYHGRPRLVMMSIEEYDRIGGRQHLVLDAVELSDDIIADLRAIADRHQIADEDLGLVGGLLNEDAEGEGSAGPKTP